MKKIFKKLAYIIGISIGVIFLLASAHKLLLLHDRKIKIQYGNELIQKIEQYRYEENKIPESNDWEILKQLGIPTEMSDQPYYRKRDEDTYEFSYNEGFLEGPYLTYNSDKKKWEITY